MQKYYQKNVLQRKSICDQHHQCGDAVGDFLAIKKETKTGVSAKEECFPSLSLYVSHFIGHKSLLQFQSHTPGVYGKGHSLPPSLPPLTPNSS